MSTVSGQVLSSLNVNASNKQRHVGKQAPMVRSEAFSSHSMLFDMELECVGDAQPVPSTAASEAGGGEDIGARARADEEADALERLATEVEEHRHNNTHERLGAQPRCCSLTLESVAPKKCEKRGFGAMLVLPASAF
jgi:hypothetical protein